MNYNLCLLKVTYKVGCAIEWYLSYGSNTIPRDLEIYHKDEFGARYRTWYYVLATIVFLRLDLG